MPPEMNATEVTTTAAPIVDVTAPPAEAAPASAAPAEGATTVDTTATTTTATEGDDSSTQQEEQDRNERGQFKSGVQKRIDELTFRRNAAEREAAYWKGVAQSQGAAPAAPKPGDFDNDEDYAEAMQQHRIETGVNKGIAKTAEANAQRFQTEAQSVAAETYNQRVAAVQAHIPDFKDVVSQTSAQISAPLHDAIMESERGPELVYHLAKNPEVADRLNKMDVRQMDREIGRLEASFSTKPAAPATPAPPPAARTTSAPPPIKPGNPASAPASSDPSKMTQAEFEAWAKANGSRFIR